MKKLLTVLLAAALLLGMVSLASAEETGKVYYLNFKPEADQAWQDLAKAYTEQTGVEVKVLTAASGTYSDTLTAEMEKKDAAPTLFQIGNAEGVATWADYALKLDGTDLMNEMTTADFNLKNANGDTVAVGYCYEAYGIITNVALLQKAGHSLDEIKDFASLNSFNYNSAKRIEAPESPVQSTPSPTEDDALSAGFKRLMDDKKLFLQPNLTLEDVADILHSNKTYVSRMVNNSYGLGFSELMNRMRVDYAKEYILSHRSARQSEIARNCGFLSASSFNTVFKKVTGTTPKIWFASTDNV